MNPIAHRGRLLLGLAASLGSVQGLMAADGRNAEPRGSFSDICVQSPTGDLLGTEVSFLPAPDGGRVLLRRAEGGWQPPVRLAWRSSDSRHLVGFETGVGGAVVFVAEFKAPDRLVLKFQDGQSSRDGSAVATLTRRRPAWTDPQALPTCR